MNTIEDLHYCAEYAKSGRSKCRGCKNFIQKETLRLAYRIWATRFDKKIEHWYHLDCFFDKRRPKSKNDVRNFESLHIDDQIEIQKRLNASRKRKRNECNSENFFIENAKTGRAACKTCKETILKNEIRFREKTNHWHHVSCFDFGDFNSIDQLTGFESLQQEDQEAVRKILQEDDPVAKKAKLDLVEGLTEEESKLYFEQNEILFKHREALKHLSKRELEKLINHNQQFIRNQDDILDFLADCMTFGALYHCGVCGYGPLIFEKFGYRCTGSTLPFTKCKTLYREPIRRSFEIPLSISKNYSYFHDYKYVRRTRVFPHQPTNSKILHKMKFIILGKPKRTEKMLKQQIQNMGGQVITRNLSREVVAGIASLDDITEMNDKMQEIRRTKVHVVPEEFVDEAPEYEGKIKELVEARCICDWGSVDRLNHVMDSVVQVAKNQTVSQKTVILAVKNGAVVDPKSGLQHVAHVYSDNSDKFTASLSRTEVQNKKNSYYNIQLLESNTGNKYWVYRSWGRIGTKIGDAKLTPFDSLDEAKSSFCQLFEEKTGNKWKYRHYFQKIRGLYTIQDVSYPEPPKPLQVPDPRSTLAIPVQNLMNMIFDVDAMEKELLKFELDLGKMPLGKLSGKQILRAYGVLLELEHLIEKGAPEKTFIDASNRFYSLIPHSFGRGDPVVLKETSDIKKKLEMLDSLRQIEIGYSLMKALHECDNTVDEYYKQLKTEVKVLDKHSEEYKIIEKYLTNTHGSTHPFKINIKEVFTIKREGEEERFQRFKNLHNHKLLWHGSRTTNFAGILSRGLQIAPPEAPYTGYMFGKGIYFADMVSKAGQYTCLFDHKANPTGLLLLCDVALGDMYEKKHFEYVEKLSDGKHSTKGLGTKIPNPEGYIYYKGMEVPLGREVKLEGITSLSLEYNEYIVYDIAQVYINYLIQVSFESKN